MMTGMNRTTFRSGMKSYVSIRISRRQIIFRLHSSFPTIYAARNFWPDSNMNQLLRSPAKTQAFRVWIPPPRDTIPCFDRTLFSFKSALVFTCFLFGKTNSIFLTSIIHTIKHAKQNWIWKFWSPYQCWTKVAVLR